MIPPRSNSCGEVKCFGPILQYPGLIFIIETLIEFCFGTIIVGLGITRVALLGFPIQDSQIKTPLIKHQMIFPVSTFTRYFSLSYFIIADIKLSLSPKYIAR